MTSNARAIPIPPSIANLFAALLAVLSLAPTQSLAQHADKRLYCSAYFQARAAWMRSLEGNMETIGLMEDYAEILWWSIPMDRGMYTGPATSSETYEPDQSAILGFLTQWASAGHDIRALPVCMEDATCLSCKALLRAASR